MSTALAIASVTYVLKDLLNNGLIDHDITGAVGGNVSVTALPPDRIETGAATEGSQLNLFMYQATPNAGWRNHGLPSHNAGGERATNPPLALDLHYLLSAYGAEELHPEILLGYGMQLLHETPVLARDAIRTSLAPPATVGGASLPLNLRALSTSNLADQIELIKITPETLNGEELSRLWSAFGAKYRPNAAYKATVVLIESTRTTKAALPVQSRKIHVVPFKQPLIEKIASRVNAASPIVPNQKVLSNYGLVISGSLLKDALVLVNIDGIEIIPATDAVEDNQIIIPIPPTLSAGIHGVQVVHQIAMGSPPVPHKGTSSNVAAFVLCPSISALSVVNPQGSPFVSAFINITVTPAVFPGQQVVLLLNEMAGTAGSIPLAYSFQPEPAQLLSPPGAKVNISIPIEEVQSGTYLVRIRVDGAESPLLADAAGNYSEPQVTLP